MRSKVVVERQMGLILSFINSQKRESLGIPRLIKMITMVSEELAVNMWGVYV